VDLGIFRIHIAGASSIGVSINFLFTTLKNFSFNLNDRLILIFSFFILISNLLGVIFYFEIYLTILDMVDIILGGGGSGSSSGSSFNFNNPTTQPGGQPPKGRPPGPSGSSGFFRDKKLDELKENLINDNDKENINKDKEMRINKKDDSISSSDQRRNYGSKENLLKDKTNKKKKCNII